MLYKAAISKVISLLLCFLFIIWSYPLMNCSLTLISYYPLNQTQISEYFFQRLLLAWPTLWLFSSPALIPCLSPSRLTKFIVMVPSTGSSSPKGVSLCSTFSISMKQQLKTTNFSSWKSQLKDQLLQGVFPTHLPIHQLITDLDFHHSLTLK